VHKAYLAMAVVVVFALLLPRQLFSQSAEHADAVRKGTVTLVKNNSISERYLLLQKIKEHPPDSSGVSSFDLNGSTQEVSADAVKAAATADGTYEPFGAVFDVLGSFGDAGSGSVPGAQTGIQTQAFGVINWESEHYGYKNCSTPGGQVTYKDCETVEKDGTRKTHTQRLDFSFGGQLGLYPAVVLENLTSTSVTIAQPKARPMFQDAFHWTIGPNLNYVVFAHGEASAFADFGQNFLINEVSSYKEGDGTVTATPVSNGVGRATFFTEGGLQFKILANPIWLAHDDKVSNLSPLFMVAAGVRRDNRFNASGDLTGYDKAPDRVFFRFFLTLTKIGSVTDATKPAAPASIRFGVEVEKPFSEQRIPTATRFYVSANLDILKLFRPSSPSGTQQ
jgi:hypothetical protein